MAADADIGPTEAPRKSREDIDREPQQSRPNGRSAERRYFIAGVVACVATQLLILGGIVLTRYLTEAVRGRAVSIAPAVSSRAAATSTAAALPLPVAGSVPDAVVNTPPSARAATGIPVTPPSTTSASVKSLSRLPVQQSVSNVPASPRTPFVGPTDWAESQAELRSALERWLIIEDRDDMDFANADVILGADGETAKTRVPSSRGGRKIVEQRWQRRTNGWVIVDHREIGVRQSH